MNTNVDMDGRRIDAAIELFSPESCEKLRNIIAEIPDRVRRHDDFRDWSRDPSFTTTEIPYHMKCEQRYLDCRKMYEEQFQKEIRMHLANQATAYEEARLHRHLCITSLWPPLHNRREIENTQRYFFRMKRKDREHLNYLLSTKIN